MKTFYSNGKLLLTAEYLILKGAKGLAVPSSYGQGMEINEKESKQQILSWEALEYGKPWFTCQIGAGNFKVLESSDSKIADYVAKLVQAAHILNPDVLQNGHSYSVQTNLNFNREWGLGSSSTLISNLAQWFNINALELNTKVSKGSGYDVACAQNKTPVVYSVSDKKQPVVEVVNFNPVFNQQLFFVYQGVKKATEHEVNTFVSRTEGYTEEVKHINAITSGFLNATNIIEFMLLMNKHEGILSELLNTQSIKQKYYTDFKGEIKSLGAWGGDFMLVASIKGEEYVRNYFIKKDMPLIFNYKQLVLNS